MDNWSKTHIPALWTHGYNLELLCPHSLVTRAPEMEEAPVERQQQEDFSHKRREIRHVLLGWEGFPCGSAGRESTSNAGDLGSIPGLGRSPGEGKGYPLQYSGLENSINCTVHGAAKSQTRLSDFHVTSLGWDTLLTKTKAVWFQGRSPWQRSPHALHWFVLSAGISWIPILMCQALCCCGNRAVRMMDPVLILPKLPKMKVKSTGNSDTT